MCRWVDTCFRHYLLSLHLLALAVVELERQVLPIAGDNQYIGAAELLEHVGVQVDVGNVLIEDDRIVEVGSNIPADADRIIPVESAEDTSL